MVALLGVMFSIAVLIFGALTVVRDRGYRFDERGRKRDRRRRRDGGRRSQDWLAAARG